MAKSNIDSNENGCVMMLVVLAFMVVGGIIILGGCFPVFGVYR